MVKTPNSSRHSENVFKKMNQDSLERVLNYTQWAISKFSKTITIPICSQICMLGACVDIIKMAYFSSVITEPGLEELQCAGGCRDTDGSWVHVPTCLSIHFVMVPRLPHIACFPWSEFWDHASSPDWMLPQGLAVSCQVSFDLASESQEPLLVMYITRASII